MLDSLPVGCGKVNIANEQKARLPHRTKCLFSLTGDHSVQLLMGSFSETWIETQRKRRFVSSQQWNLESSVAESSVGSMQRRECPATSGNVFFGRMVAIVGAALPKSSPSLLLSALSAFSPKAWYKSPRSRLERRNGLSHF